MLRRLISTFSSTQLASITGGARTSHVMLHRNFASAIGNEVNDGINKLPTSTSTSSTSNKVAAVLTPAFHKVVSSTEQRIRRWKIGSAIYGVGYCGGIAAAFAFPDAAFAAFGIPIGFLGGCLCLGILSDQSAKLRMLNYVASFAGQTIPSSATLTVLNRMVAKQDLDVNCQSFVPPEFGVLIEKDYVVLGAMEKE